MQECCIFLNGFFPLPRLTPSGPKFLYILTVGADACHRPAGAGTCLRGGAMQASPTTTRYAVVRSEHYSPVNVEIRQMAAGEQCSPLHPL